MNKERLIDLAKQAGWEYADDDRGFEPLWRFAALVRADEREAVCDIVDYELDSNGHAEAIKIAIRARSNA